MEGERAREQTGEVETAWGDVPRGLYRREWEASKAARLALDYCGLCGVNKGEGSIVRRMRALSGRRKIVKRALNDKVIVLGKVAQLHSALLSSEST